MNNPWRYSDWNLFCFSSTLFCFFFVFFRKTLAGPQASGGRLKSSGRPLSISKKKKIQKKSCFRRLRSEYLPPTKRRSVSAYFCCHVFVSKVLARNGRGVEGGGAFLRVKNDGKRFRPERKSRESPRNALRNVAKPSHATHSVGTRTKSPKFFQFFLLLTLGDTRHLRIGRCNCRAAYFLF